MTLKNRGQERHPTSNMRYYFNAEGEEHRAVCGNVALGGAFLRSRFVPEPGQMVTLEARSRGAGVHLVCRVAWALSRPRLDAPETGFGVSFIEAYSSQGEGALRDYLRDEFSLHSVGLTQAERDGRATHSYVFAKQQNTEAEGQVHSPMAPGTDPDAGLSPAYQHLTARGAVISWGQGECMGRLTHLTDAMLRIEVQDACPPLYERVTITPAYPSIHMPSLMMHGTITGSAPADTDRATRLAIRIWEIEELNQKATFEAFRRLFDGGS